MVFRHVRIHLTHHFTNREAPLLRDKVHAEKMQSLTLLGDALAAMTFIDGSERREEGREGQSIWRWAKSLKIAGGCYMRDDQGITEERLETLVHALHGLGFVQHIE